MNWQERAEKAEAELERLREQEPVAYVKYKATGGNVGLSWFAIPTQVYYPREGEPLYVNPIPIPAPAVPSGWNIRRDGDVLIVQHPDIGGCSVHKDPDRERMIPEAILYSLADALLQSAVPLYAAPVPAPSVQEEWREAMQEAYDTFQRYADLHQAKGTHDGYEKAKANQKLANKLYALLQSAPTGEPK